MYTVFDKSSNLIATEGGCEVRRITFCIKVGVNVIKIINYQLFTPFRVFSMVSHWSLNDNKFPQVSRTFLSILANHNNAVVWIVSTRPLISKSFILYPSPLVTVPSAPITIGITVTFTFHSFSVL